MVIEKRCRQCGGKLEKSIWNTPTKEAYNCVKCGLAIFKTKSGEWEDNPF